MDTGGPQGLALWALSPGLEFSARPCTLLLGCCGQQYLLEAQCKRVSVYMESIKTAGPAPPVPPSQSQCFPTIAQALGNVFLGVYLSC